MAISLSRYQSTKIAGAALRSTWTREQPVEPVPRERKIIEVYKLTEAEFVAYLYSIIVLMTAAATDLEVIALYFTIYQHELGRIPAALRRAAERHGYDIILRQSDHINTANFLGILAAQEQVLFSNVQRSVIFLSLNLPIGREPGQGWDLWLASRQRGLKQALSMDDDDVEFTADHLPIKVCKAIHRFFLTNITMRQELCRDILRAKESGMMAEVYHAVCKLRIIWEYSEMSSIQLIFEYLFQPFPHPALLLPELASFQVGLKDALDYIQNAPEQERPYLKLLRGQHETAVLSTQPVRQFAAVAKIIANKRGQMRDYQTKGLISADPEATKARIESMEDAKMKFDSRVSEQDRTAIYAGNERFEREISAILSADLAAQETDSSDEEDEDPPRQPAAAAP